MINIQKTIDGDFVRVREALINHLNLCIINGKFTLIFNVKQYSMLSNRKLHRAMRQQLYHDIEQLEQVKQVKIKQLQDYFPCSCHKKCLSINKYFRKNKIRCGTDCYFTVLGCSVGDIFEICSYRMSTCKRMIARDTYDASDKTSLLIITLNHHEICPVIYLKQTKPLKHKNYISNDENT